MTSQGLPGIFKALIYKNGTVLKILWSQVVCEVPISTIESLQRNIRIFLWVWLGFQRNLSSIAFYGKNTKLWLPLRSLEEGFEMTQGRYVI